MVSWHFTDLKGLGLGSDNEMDDDDVMMPCQSEYSNGGYEVVRSYTGLASRSCVSMICFQIHFGYCLFAI